MSGREARDAEAIDNCRGAGRANDDMDGALRHGKRELVERFADGGRGETDEHGRRFMAWLKIGSL